MKREFLNCFWDLAVDEPETRNAAGKSLIGFITERNEDSESPDSKVSSINYAFSRLTKGLSSSRESARQGFSCCLTELLSLGVVCVDDTIIAIDEVTKVTSQISCIVVVIIGLQVLYHQ